MLSATLLCLVVGIVDGDTLKARCEGTQVTIRLAEIDAPEKRQPFNKESKQSLSDLCFDKKAIVTSQRIDRYRRMIGYVECNGKDASTEQIKGGMAWVYDKYVSNRGLYNLQNAAQSKRKGLWADANPSPPWEWRKQRRMVNN